MSRAKRAMVLAMALGGWGAIGRAQQRATPLGPDLVLSTRFQR